MFIRLEVIQASCVQENFESSHGVNHFFKEEWIKVFSTHHIFSKIRDVSDPYMNFSFFNCTSSRILRARGQLQKEGPKDTHD